MVTRAVTPEIVIQIGTACTKCPDTWEGLHPMTTWHMNALMIFVGSEVGWGGGGGEGPQGVAKGRVSAEGTVACRGKACQTLYLLPSAAAHQSSNECRDGAGRHDQKY